MKKEFFVEDFSGEVYTKTIFDGDELSNLKREKTSSKVETVTEPLRMFNDVDVERKAFQTVDSNYKLSGNFGMFFSNYFSGKIFCNI